MRGAVARLLPVWFFFVDLFPIFPVVHRYLVNASGASCQSSNYSDYMRMMNNISLESDAADGTRQWTYQVRGNGTRLGWSQR